MMRRMQVSFTGVGATHVRERAPVPSVMSVDVSDQSQPQSDGQPCTGEPHSA